MITRTQILEHVWDFAYDGLSNVVDQYVAYLRKKIDKPFGRHDLQTVRGVGYRLALPTDLTHARPGPAHTVGALGVIVLTSVGGWVFVHQLRNGLHTSVDSALRIAPTPSPRRCGDAQGGIDFQDSGTTKLLNAREAIAQIVAPDGRVVESSEAAGARSLLPVAVLRDARTRTTYAEGHTPGDSTTTRFLATPVTRATGDGSSSSAPPWRQPIRPWAACAGLLVGGALAIALAIGGAWLLGTLALRPVERMRRQAAAISEHDAETRLTVPSTHDEIAELGHTVNALLARLQRALTQQRAFVADAGHELRTPPRDPPHRARARGTARSSALPTSVSRSRRPAPKPNACRT